MSESIGKLDTPSGKGAYIEVKEDDTIYFDGYTERLNFKTHCITGRSQPYKGLYIKDNRDIPSLKNESSEIMLMDIDSENLPGSVILRT